MAGPLNIVDFYKDERGRRPYLEWLSRLRDQEAVRMVETAVEKLQRQPPKGIKGVGAGVRELRVHYGPGYRVYYGQQGKRLYLLLCGGDKSSQRRDIARAKAYWQDHKRRFQA